MKKKSICRKKIFYSFKYNSFIVVFFKSTGMFYDAGNGRSFTFSASTTFMSRATAETMSIGS